MIVNFMLCVFCCKKLKRKKQSKDLNLGYLALESVFLSLHCTAYLEDAQ